MATKIRNVYKGLKPDSVEGWYMEDMGKTVFRLQGLFAATLEELRRKVDELNACSFTDIQLPGKKKDQKLG